MQACDWNCTCARARMLSYICDYGSRRWHALRRRCRRLPLFITSRRWIASCMCILHKGCRRCLSVTCHRYPRARVCVFAGVHFFALLVCVRELLYTCAFALLQMSLFIDGWPKQKQIHQSVKSRIIFHHLAINHCCELESVCVRVCVYTRVCV